MRTDRVVLRGRLASCGEDHVELFTDDGRARRVPRDMIRLLRTDDRST